MRLPLIICTLCAVVARGAARKDFDVTCLSEKSCVLPCQIQGLSKVMWSKDMLELNSFPKSQRHHEHFMYRNRTSLFVHEIPNGNCSLVINNAKPKDSGIYKCDSTSQSGTNEYLYYNLSVSAPVEVVVIEQSGDFLTCSSERVHPKPDCRWLGAFSNSTVQQDDQLLYSINCTTPLRHNITQYNCIVRTPFSSKRATYMQLPPIITSGSEASLHCASSAGPVKTVSWMFNHHDSILNLSSQHQQVSERWRPFVSVTESGNLRLENLTSDQQGLFTCVTSTDTETYTTTMRLEMKESLSVIAVVAALLTSTVLTVLLLGGYRCCQTTSEAPASDSQPNRSQSPSAAEPLDRFHLVRFMCYLVGLGSVLPWYFFVTASLYFKYRMDSQSWVLSLIALVSLLPHLISEGFNSFFGLRFLQRKHTSGCLIAITLIFVAILISIKVPMAGETFFVISMSALWLASLLSSIVQHRLRFDVDLLPPRHKKSFANGQASAGIFASVVMIVWVAVTEDDNLSVFCHFFTAFVVSMAALITYWLLQHHEFAKYHFNKERHIEEESSLEPLAPIDQKNNNNNQELPQSPDGLLPNWMGDLHAGFCVTLVQILTFSVYPAITADVHTTYPGKWGCFFIPVCCFLIVHIFHWIGEKIVLISGAAKHFLIVFPIFIFMHTAFIPWFMFCNVQPRFLLPDKTYLSDDTAYTISMALFSLFGGFLTLLSQLYEPNSERGAGTGISKIPWKVLGATIGVLLSFAFRAII